MDYLYKFAIADLNELYHGTTTLIRTITNMCQARLFTISVCYCDSSIIRLTVGLLNPSMRKSLYLEESFKLKKIKGFFKTFKYQMAKFV